jgi:ubiquinone/menaquinone biosynthesis C-methylase UbiE
VTGGQADSRDRAHRPATGHAHDHGGLAGRAWTREEALGALEAPERRQSQDPDALWTRIGLAPGATVVDVGAGTGFFAVEAARRVGPEGRVYAVDLSDELVELLRERRDRESLPQLQPLRNTLTSIPLPSAVADVVLLANVLHDIPVSTLSEAVRLVKPRGRFVNVDWKKEQTPGGPPLEIRLTPDEAEQLLEKQGLKAVERWEFGRWHYALVLERSSPMPHRDGASGP